MSMVMENHPTIVEILRMQRKAMEFPVGSPQRQAFFKFIETVKDKMTAASTAATGKVNG